MNVKKRQGEGDTTFFLRCCLMASAAGMWGEAVTIPLDTAKVRLQLQKTAEGEVPRYKGLFGTCGKVAAEEGVMALFSGLTPGLQRQFVFAGLRIGLYVPIRNMICGELKPGENPTLLQKILAGLATGAIGISVANPTDVVKVRMQAQGQLPVAERPYNGSIDCYRKTIAEGGVGNLWRGLGPNIMRNSVINAAEIASYDQYKQILTQNIGMPDSLITHLTCAMAAGFTACIVGSPVDVLKTRIMNRTPDQKGGIGTIVGNMIKNEGPLSFYKGFTANFMRLGCWNCVMFVTLE